MKFLLVVIVLAVTIYLTVRLIERRGGRLRELAETPAFQQPEEAVDQGREDHDDEQELSHTSRVGTGASPRPGTAANVTVTLPTRLVR